MPRANFSLATANPASGYYTIFCTDAGGVERPLIGPFENVNQLSRMFDREEIEALVRREPGLEDAVDSIRVLRTPRAVEGELNERLNPLQREYLLEIGGGGLPPEMYRANYQHHDGQSFIIGTPDEIAFEMRNRFYFDASRDPVSVGDSYAWLDASNNSVLRISNITPEWAAEVTASLRKYQALDNELTMTRGREVSASSPSPSP